MNAVAASPSGRVDAETRRQLIVASAGTLFAARPFHEVTTKQLAESAGVSEALIFQHFGSKQGLYVAVVEEGVDQFAAAVQGIIETIVTLPEVSVERLEALFTTALDYYLSVPGMLRSFLTEPNAEDVRRSYYSVLLEREAEMLPSIEKARRGGLLPDVDPRVLVRALFSQPLTFVISEEWLNGKELGPLDRDALPGELARLWAAVLSSAPAARRAPD